MVVDESNFHDYRFAVALRSVKAQSNLWSAFGLLLFIAPFFQLNFLLHPAAEEQSIVPFFQLNSIDWISLNIADGVRIGPFALFSIGVYVLLLQGNVVCDSKLKGSYHGRGE